MGEDQFVGLLPHLGSQIPPSAQRADASDRYRRCRRDIRCLRLLVSHRRCRREFLILRLIVFSLTSRGLQYPAAASVLGRDTVSPAALGVAQSLSLLC